jgi:hypothetical protein
MKKPTLKGMEPPMAQSLEKSIAVLREQRASLRPFPIAAMHYKITVEARIVTNYEGGRAAGGGVGWTIRKLARLSGQRRFVRRKLVDKRVRIQPRVVVKRGQSKGNA